MPYKIEVRMFNKISLDTWNRRQTYGFFTKDERCCFSITANVEITSFLQKIKQNKEKFFPKLLYGICYILNQHEEFKMDRDAEGNLGYYDIIHPCFTVFHKKEENFTLLWTEFDNDWEKFLENYNNDMALYGDKPFTIKPLNIKNFFHISALPWLSFSNLTLTIEGQKDIFIPNFTIGKYFEENSKTMLPVAIHANHAVVDGFHASRFFSKLQTWLDEN